ncbi:MAG: hypothetical protein CM1200mP30_08310 [Pseudomonadota bacterium]|nr:MAG: hypothetical protein CM1200mP30_08310 [Pseudomonadota bacterium]
MILQKKSAASYQTVSKEKIPGEISVSETAGLHLVIGFAFGGYIVTENEDYSTKVVVSPIGRIRQTAVERK